MQFALRGYGQAEEPAPEHWYQKVPVWVWFVGASALLIGGTVLVGSIRSSRDEYWTKWARKFRSRGWKVGKDEIHECMKSGRTEAHCRKIMSRS